MKRIAKSMNFTNFKILKFYPAGDIMNTRMC